jgi:Ca-activated chloride channel family protein
MSKCLSRFRDVSQIQTHVQRGAIPSKDLLHSGLFASHFFDINPDLDVITDLVVVKLFSSKFVNPITTQEEQLLVMGLTGSADGQNARRKTDFILVIDRSGSMSESVDQMTLSPSGPMGGHTKMQLAIQATKRIFDLLDDDEEIGILLFDHGADVFSAVTPKGTIERKSFFARLDKVRPSGGTNFGPALSTAIGLFEHSMNPDRNKRIIFLTDATPTVGASPDGIRELTENAFTASNGRIGITYCGIGLSFDAGTCAVLSRAHSASVCSISNLNELEAVLMREFNYMVSPVAFDVGIELSSPDYIISEVFGGDSDCMRENARLEFRTMTASSVGSEGVKGSVLIVHLTPKVVPPPVRASIHVAVNWTPFDGGRERKDEDYFLNDEPTILTEKAFALSVYYRTLRGLLPEQHVPKNSFTPEEAVALSNLEAFLDSRSPEIVEALNKEIKMVKELVAINNKTSGMANSPE